MALVATAVASAGGCESSGARPTNVVVSCAGSIGKPPTSDCTFETVTVYVTFAWVVVASFTLAPSFATVTPVIPSSGLAMR
jgi:hypothetical protein